jgi:hypothetical protein
VHEQSERQFDPSFLKIERRIQRIAWALIALILALALLGIFGSGLLSKAHVSIAQSGSEVAVDYARFGRLQDRTDLSISIQAPNQTAEEVHVTVSGEFLSKVSIVGITPDPDSTSVGQGASIYSWQVEDWSQPVEILFEYEPKDWMSISGNMKVAAGEQDLGTLGFDLWVFP